MDIKEVIRQLEGFKKHCEVVGKEFDDPWKKDVQALEIAIETLKESDK